MLESPAAVSTRGALAGPTPGLEILWGFADALGNGKPFSVGGVGPCTRWWAWKRTKGGLHSSELRMENNSLYSFGYDPYNFVYGHVPGKRIEKLLVLRHLLGRVKMSEYRRQQPPSPPSPPPPPPPPEDTSMATSVLPHVNNSNGKKEQLQREDATAAAAAADSCAVADTDGHASNGVADYCDTGDDDGDDGQPTEERQRTVNWLSMGKQAADSRCRELEKELAKSGELCVQQEARWVQVHFSM